MRGKSPGQTLVRGVGVLAVLVLAAGAISPALGAAEDKLSGKEKQKVKKISTKQANALIPGILQQADAGSLENELQYVRSASVNVASGADGSAIATCPAGFHAIGGGGTYPAANDVQIIRSTPSNGTEGQAGTTAWEFRIRNLFGFSRDIRAYVICANADTVAANYTDGSAVD